MALESIRSQVLPVAAGCMLVVLSACSNQTGAPVADSIAATAESPASQVDWVAMQDFWERSIQLPGIDTGPVDSPKHMLIYFDPNCPVCAQQWQILKPYLKQVRIHWIPIAYMSASSQRRAAAILAAPDPAQALVDNENHYDFAKKLGGYEPPSSVPAWAVHAVESNTHSSVRMQYVPGTPALGFELYNGKRYSRMFGLADAASMKVAVTELGDTMDSWKHPATAMSR